MFYTKDTKAKNRSACQYNYKVHQSDKLFRGMEYSKLTQETKHQVFKQQQKERRKYFGKVINYCLNFQKVVSNCW